MKISPKQAAKAILLILLISRGVLFGQDPNFIEESFSVHPGYLYLADFDTFGETTDPDKDPRPQDARIPQEIEDKVYIYLLDEAAWIISGTIYGFRFEYQPFDRKRNITDKFTITPIGSIPKGNKRLQVMETGYTENREEIFIKIRYHYSETEKKRINMWNSTSFPTSGGLGGVPINLKDCDQQAIKEAIKEAIRNHIRPLVRNKPGKITGIVALRKPPLIYYDAGECLSRVVITLRYDKIEHNRFSRDVQ